MDVIARGGGGGGATGWSAVLLVSAMLGIVAVLTIVRRRKGGMGPRVGWVPRRLRSRVNTHYRRNDWPEPFDSDGNRIERPRPNPFF